MVGEEDGAVVVFTKETRREILNQGGSRGWVVNPRSVEKCPYLVCCRREQWDNRSENTKHRAAFLVGRITNLERVDESENARGQARFEIRISEYAGIDRRNTWRKDLRNPVAYSTLKKLGIELKDLKFEPVMRPSNGSGERRQMTIAQAKEALAASFGVKPEDVEIIIRG
jgi:hypothetical protein